MGNRHIIFLRAFLGGDRFVWRHVLVAFCCLADALQVDAAWTKSEWMSVIITMQCCRDLMLGIGGCLHCQAVCYLIVSTDSFADTYRPGTMLQS